MLEKCRDKVALCALFLLSVVIGATYVDAAEYSQVYRFTEPKAITLPNDRQILEMEGTWLRDDLVGAPMLPVKTCIPCFMTLCL